jgi:hypothetical protein
MSAYMAISVVCGIVLGQSSQVPRLVSNTKNSGISMSFAMGGRHYLASIAWCDGLKLKIFLGSPSIIIQHLLMTMKLQLHINIQITSKLHDFIVLRQSVHHVVL